MKKGHKFWSLRHVLFSKITLTLRSVAAFKHTIQHSSNLQIFAKTMSGFKSRFAPGEASWQRGYKIYSEIVRFSSDLVEISSDLVEISSDLVEISSELISRILELMIISTFRKTSESKFRTTFPAIISTIRTFFLINNNYRLLCSFFASTHHGLWQTTNIPTLLISQKKGLFRVRNSPYLWTNHLFKRTKHIRNRFFR